MKTRIELTAKNLLPKFVILGKCKCGLNATFSTRKGISPGIWTKAELQCENCYRKSLELKGGK